MKNKNIILGFIILAISGIGVLIYNLIPQFETTEFNKELILDISEGATTTSVLPDTSTTIIDNEFEDNIQILPSKLETLLENNNTENNNFFPVNV